VNLARASVLRPVFTSMLTLIVLVLGSVALSRLQIDLLPSIELPTLTVRTQYEGADPVVMERLVTQIVEEIVATVPGVEEISSSSYEGNSRVRVSFGWGTDIDSAALDVRATLEDEISELPDDIVGPRVSKFDIDSYPVVILGISSRLDPVAGHDMLTAHRGPALPQDVVGVSVALAGIAETGTLLLASGPDTPTSLNFLPDVHIVAVSADSIRGSYEDAWAEVRARFPTPPRTLNMITGPSRTGDIEQTIQLGAHGPRQVHVVVVNER